MDSPPKQITQTAEVFILDTDCFEAVFEYLHLKDVVAIGMTCKQLQEIAGNYFGYFHPGKRVEIYHDGSKVIEKVFFDGDYMNIEDHNDTNFGGYVQTLSIEIASQSPESEELELLQYAAKVMSPHLKSVSFFQLNTFSPAHERIYKEIVKDVECVRFEEFYDIDREYSDDVLKHCTNLKKLTIKWDLVHYLHKNYPKLECLVLDSSWSLPNINDLKEFIEINPQIKKLHLDQLIDGFQDIRMPKLDLLKIRHFPMDSAETFVTQVNTLHAQGVYKEVQISLYSNFQWTDHINEIQQIQGLTKIEYYYPDREDNTAETKALVQLSQINELTIYGMKHADAEILSKGLINLKRLNVSLDSFDTILPLACRLSKLTEIMLTKDVPINIDATKIQVISKARRKLNGARKLKIYAEDETFIQAKWACLQLKYRLVEVKHKGTWDMVNK